MRPVTAFFVCIDGWNRPVFKGDDGLFYCLVDVLFGFGEKPTQEQIDGHSVYLKGRKREGEPGWSVDHVKLLA